MIAVGRLSPTPAMALLVALSATLGVLTAYQPITALALLVTVVAVIPLLRYERSLLIAFLVFLVLQDPLRFAVGGDYTTAGYFVKRADEALLIIIAAWTLLTSSRVHRALRARRIRWAILACIGGVILSSVFAHTELVPGAMDLLLFSKPFLIFALGCSIPAEAFAEPRRIAVLLATMSLVILFGLLFLWFPQLHEGYLGGIREIDTRMGLHSAQGFFDGPGPYSWFCATTFAVAYAAYLAFRRRAYAWVSVLAAIFTILSWRRKSIAGIVAMVALAALLRSHRDQSLRRRAIATLLAIVVIGSTVLAPLVGSLWDFTLKEYGGDPTRVARFALHQTSVQIALDRFPLGLGLASFGSHASRVYYSQAYYEYGLANIWGLNPEHPAFITDTFWPMVLGEGGVITFVPYALFIGLPLVVFWRAARRKDITPSALFVVLSGLFVLLGSLLESTASPIYSATMQSALALIVPGIAWSQFGPPENKADLQVRALT